MLDYLVERDLKMQTLLPNEQKCFFFHADDGKPEDKIHTFKCRGCREMCERTTPQRPCRCDEEDEKQVSSSS